MKKPEPAKAGPPKPEPLDALTQRAWEKVQMARRPGRPYSLDFINGLCSDFVELHGDRGFGDDPALVGGLAMLAGRPVVVMGQQKGAEVQEKLKRNFAMMHPEGYRKALRLMELADRFSRPVISFVDTPGAYPGVGAEKRGQAEAIARNIRDMFGLRVPVIVAVIGEGGSGGALGVGVGDAILMLSNAYYSVISPEGCAAILWRDRAKAPQAAKALRITAEDLLQLRVIDEVIPEPPGGAQTNPKAAIEAMGIAIRRWLSQLRKLSPEELLEARYRKFRAMGPIQEGLDGAPRGGAALTR